MGLFSLSFQIGTISEITDAESNSFVQEFLSNTQEISGLEIFANNSIAALPMLIPGIGMIFGMYTAWTTGFGFAALISMAPGLSEITPLSIFYLSPFGMMELAAYSISMSRSFHILFVLVKRVKLKSLIKPTLIEVGVVLTLLFVGSYLEEYMIKISQDGASLFG